MLRAGHQGARAHRRWRTIDAKLCAQVAAGLGLPVPKKIKAEKPRVQSPALRQITPTPFPIAGRIVGVVAGPGADLDGIATLRKALEAEGALLRVIAPHGGQLTKGRQVEIVERTFATGRSIEFDAIVVADGAPKDGDFRALVMLQEAFRHLKAVGAWGDGVDGARAPPASTRRRRACSPARRRTPSWPPAPIAALGMHRAWDRTPLVAASAVPPTVKA